MERRWEVSNYTKEDYQQALFSLQCDVKDRKEFDIEFLEEMEEHIKLYQERKDPTRLEMVKDMIDHWLDQLRKEVKS